MARGQDIVSETRALTRQLRDSLYGLKKLQDEVTSLGGVSNIPDGEGANLGVTAQETADVLTTTANAFLALLPAGHGTNLAKLL